MLKIGAANVKAFVGVGGPYWQDENGDGIINDSDAVLDEGAMGVAMTVDEFGLALMKEVPPASSTTLKSFTAHEINKALGRKGDLWQAEYYDVLIDSNERMEQVRHYIE